ncbi:PAAR domain-containing protein [Halopseudomonas sp.]|uniref:PAAR domain-containing protein n=1 Tax=Halopseudomonas sp. TaxID=2901191 RepID=UPI003001830C
MAGKPAARLGDRTACSQSGHSPATIVSGSPDVFINGLPAARLGDTTSCGSALIGNASSTIMINGKPAMILGGLGSHGDVIVSGSGDVIFGDHVSGLSNSLSESHDQHSWIGFRIEALESYSGLDCKAYFADGKVLTGRFGADNRVRFSGLSGVMCERLELEVPEAVPATSVTEQLLSQIAGVQFT